MALKTREKLIEVARQLFAHKGVANTTMNDIAAASSKGRRTVYTYFRNKRDIYNAVLESESESLVASLRDIVQSSEPLEQRLRHFLRFRLEHNTVQASSSLKSWFKFDSRRIERINDLVNTKENELLDQLIAEGIQSGTFIAERCQLLLDFINHCISRLDIPQPHEVDPEKRERAIASFIEFIATDITAPARP